MSYQLKYGTYTFPVGMYPADDNLPVVVPQSKRVRTDGGRLLAPTLNAKAITIKGTLIPAPGNPVRPILDALRAAVFSGPQPLTFQGDRYWRNVVCKDLKVSHPGSWYNKIADVEVDLVTGDPFEYELATQSVNLNPTSTTVSGTATAGGNAYAAPAISFTAATTALNVTLYNDTTGEAFVLVGTVSIGDVIVVDCLNEQVTLAGVDKMTFFEGLFPRLIVGANTLRAVYLAGALSAISVTWQNRWY